MTAAAMALRVTGAWAADMATAADHFSVGGIPAAAAGPPAFTLLDREWLLPPVESLETGGPVTSTDRTDQMLRDDTDAALPPAAPASGPLGYSLSDHVTANLHYDHAQVSDLASSQTLRDDTSTGFSTRPDRDVVGLNMSWSLAGSTVGLGYQLESTRLSSGGEVGINRFLPGNQQALQSITLGLTRAWGASTPPAIIVEPPLAPPPLDVAAAAASPTPVSLRP